MWTALFAIIVFFAALFWSENFVGALIGSFLLWLVIRSAGAPYPGPQGGSSTPGSSGSGPGLLSIVLMAVGASWLFGGRDEDCDC